MPMTRKEYMEDSSACHHEYYSQFVTEMTHHFVLTWIGRDLLESSTCPYFNDIIKHVRNQWVWDYAPVNVELMRKCGEIGQNSIPSPASVTYVAKAAARMLLEEAANG